MSLRTFSKIAVVVAILLGIGMVALGVIFILMGYGAKSDILERPSLKRRSSPALTPQSPTCW